MSPWPFQTTGDVFLCHNTKTQQGRFLRGCRTVRREMQGDALPNFLDSVTSSEPSVRLRCTAPPTRAGPAGRCGLPRAALDCTV